MGVHPEQISEEEGGSPEELKLIIAESVQGGKIDPGEAGMLSASSTSTSRRRARS